MFIGLVDVCGLGYPLLAFHINCIFMIRMWHRETACLLRAVGSHKERELGWGGGVSRTRIEMGGQHGFMQLQWL